jgi:hypothetical protein
MRPSGWVTVPSFSAWDSAGSTMFAWAVDSSSCIATETTKLDASALRQPSESGCVRTGSAPISSSVSSSPEARPSLMPAESCPAFADGA